MPGEHKPTDSDIHKLNSQEPSLEWCSFVEWAGFEPATSGVLPMCYTTIATLPPQIRPEDVKGANLKTFLIDWVNFVIFVFVLRAVLFNKKFYRVSKTGATTSVEQLGGQPQFYDSVGQEDYQQPSKPHKTVG